MARRAGGTSSPGPKGSRRGHSWSRAQARRCGQLAAGPGAWGWWSVAGLGSIRPGPSRAPRMSHGGSHRQPRLQGRTGGHSQLNQAGNSSGGGGVHTPQRVTAPQRGCARAPSLLAPPATGSPPAPDAHLSLGHRCFSSSPPTSRPAGRHRHAQCGTRGQAVLGPLPSLGVGGGGAWADPIPSGQGDPLWQEGAGHGVEQWW